MATIGTGENLNFAVPIDSAAGLLASTQHTSFADMRAATIVRQPILSSSISVPPQVMEFDLNAPQGGVLSGDFSIAGGMGNDLGVSLISATGGLVWNGGIIQRAGNLNLQLQGGRYKLVFNNRMGPFWVSPKTLSGTLELCYYR